ncbi:MAG: PH domain-containing protein [Egibacteraceae bacterium]
MRRFPAAPLDRFTRLTTGLFLGIVLVVALVTGSATRDPLTLLVVLLASAVAVCAVWGFAPDAFEVGPGELRVRRNIFGTLAFQVEGPADRADRPSFGLGGLRVLGSGGAFGWYGRFWRPGLGFYRAYVTDRSTLVAVPTDRGLVIVSPADADAFTTAVTRK